MPMRLYAYKNPTCRRLQMHALSKNLLQLQQQLFFKNPYFFLGIFCHRTRKEREESSEAANSQPSGIKLITNLKVGALGWLLGTQKACARERCIPHKGVVGSRQLKDAPWRNTFNGALCVRHAMLPHMLIFQQEPSCIASLEKMWSSFEMLVLACASFFRIAV